MMVDCFSFGEVHWVTCVQSVLYEGWCSYITILHGPLMLYHSVFKGLAGLFNVYTYWGIRYRVWSTYVGPVVSPKTQYHHYSLYVNNATWFNMHDNTMLRFLIILAQNTVNVNIFAGNKFCGRGTYTYRWDICGKTFSRSAPYAKIFIPAYYIILPIYVRGELQLAIYGRASWQLHSRHSVVC